MLRVLNRNVSQWRFFKGPKHMFCLEIIEIVYEYVLSSEAGTLN